MILSRAIAIERKLLFSKIGLIDQFRKAVFVPLCFLPFSWSILIRKLMMGTEILKIDVEMAEKIEVEVGTFNTEIIFLPLTFFNFLMSIGQENGKKGRDTQN